MQLRERMIVDWLHRPILWWRWTPPAVPAFAGPKELARVLVSYRARLEKIREETGYLVETPAEISDEGLERLLLYAHEASFRTDEGRPVAAKLYVPKRRTGLEPAADARREHWQSRAIVHRFQKPIALVHPKLMAQLAPTLHSEDAALLVREEAGEPVLVGIALLDWEDRQRPVFGMPREGYGAEGLFINIQGPGHLRVAEGGTEYTLWANELFLHEAVCNVAPVREWLHDVSMAIVETCKQDPDWLPELVQLDELDPALEYKRPQIDVALLWSRILREAIRLRHGGAFVIVTDIEQTRRLIHLKFPLQPYDLVTELACVWLSNCRLGDAPRLPAGELQTRIEDKRCLTHHLLSTNRSVGGLSATDGCVVLDRRLVLHGFGGSILAKANGRRARKCIDLEREAEVSPDELLRPFGERHRSAYHLCDQLPGTLAFIVSQDGDLRVFASDQDHVYFADHLHP